MFVLHEYNSHTRSNLLKILHERERRGHANA